MTHTGKWNCSLSHLFIGDAEPNLNHSRMPSVRVSSSTYRKNPYPRTMASFGVGMTTDPTLVFSPPPTPNIYPLKIRQEFRVQNDNHILVSRKFRPPETLREAMQWKSNMLYTWCHRAHWETPNKILPLKQEQYQGAERGHTCLVQPASAETAQKQDTNILHCLLGPPLETTDRQGNEWRRPPPWALTTERFLFTTKHLPSSRI